MKATSEILIAIRSYILALYSRPEDSVRDLGELDCLLYCLHWLYADATDNLEMFADERWRQFAASPDVFNRLVAKKESHAPVDSFDEARELIDYWIKIGQPLGLDVTL